MEIIESILIFSEIFHIIAHFSVLSGFKPFTEKFLEKNGHYFIIDLVTLQLSFLYCMENWNFLLIIIALYHGFGHFFYVYNWNIHYYAIRIRNWSSSEYKGPLITADFFLTISDIISHSIVIYYLINTIYK
jgi:hypothetical protein